MTGQLTYTVEQLAEGQHGTLVVADFAGFSARQSLGAALAADSSDWTVLRVDAIGDLAASGGPTLPPDLGPLADGYARSLAGLDTDRTAVVGCCTAASLAARLAATLGLPLLLVQPTWPTPEAATEDFRRFRTELDADPTGTPAAPTLSVMRETLHNDLLTMAATHALDPEDTEILLEELLPRYAAWLGFVLATAEAPEHPQDAPILTDEDVPAATVLHIVESELTHGGTTA